MCGWCGGGRADDAYGVFRCCLLAVHRCGGGGKKKQKKNVSLLSKNNFPSFPHDFPSLPALNTQKGQYPSLSLDIACETWEIAVSLENYQFAWEMPVSLEKHV